MGRFYKATPREFVGNKMFQVPFEQGAAVLQNLDKNIDETYDSGIALQDELDSEKLDSDDPAVQKRYKYFNDLADASAAEMDKEMSEIPIVDQRV